MRLTATKSVLAYLYITLLFEIMTSADSEAKIMKTIFFVGKSLTNHTLTLICPGVTCLGGHGLNTEVVVLLVSSQAYKFLNGPFGLCYQE